MRTFAIVLLAALTGLTSCNSDDGNEPNNTSRTLRYELTGNFSGTNILAAYTTASGGTITEEINSIPWNKEITFDPNVTGANIVVSGVGGVAGQQVTMIIKQGGTPFGTPITATVNSGGAFSISSPVITF